MKLWDYLKELDHEMREESKEDKIEKALKKIPTERAISRCLYGVGFWLSIGINFEYVMRFSDVKEQIVMGTILGFTSWLGVGVGLVEHLGGR